MEILKLTDVSFSSQNTQIIRNVNLGIEKGKTTALVGPSGCGKSTLLKLTAGLIIPTSGTVCYQGRDIASMNRVQNLEFRRESAFVFQDSAIWANQTLQQCLELPLRIHFPDMSVETRRRRIDEVVKIVGYKRSLDIRPAVLSMGEQKLIAFGRAMLCKPKLLFLDEWTESLDENAARRLISLVKQQKLDNNTVVFVSHNMSVIKELADHVIIVVEGHVHNKMTHDQIDNEHDELSELLDEDITDDKV
jgi:phospholipid/cholesterol/gamma-HCH transport system ATP-binding protein